MAEGSMDARNECIKELTVFYKHLQSRFAELWGEQDSFNRICDILELSGIYTIKYLNEIYNRLRRWHVEKLLKIKSNRHKQKFDLQIEAAEKITFRHLGYILSNRIKFTLDLWENEKVNKILLIHAVIDSAFGRDVDLFEQGTNYLLKTTSDYNIDLNAEHPSGTRIIDNFGTPRYSNNEREDLKEYL